MKRSAALAPLSRDHHHALVVARALIHATDETAASAAGAFVEFLAHHELAHFALEESLLLPLIPADDPAAGLARRMLEDHAALRDAMHRLRSSTAAPDATDLQRLGRRLRDHVQMEERELFPYLEGSLSPSALEQIGERLQASAERRP